MKINTIAKTGSIITNSLKTFPVLHLAERENYQYNPHYNKLFETQKIVQDKIFSSVRHDYIREFILDQKEDDKVNLFKKKEILICGKSNCGKSRLLNETFGTETFKTGTNPGTTRSLNVFEILKNNAYVVDSPGYGYLGMKSKRGKKLHNLFRRYLMESSRLCRIIWCVELREGPDANDLQFLNNLKRLRMGVQIVFTKCDQ